MKIELFGKTLEIGFRASPENPQTNLADPDSWLWDALGASESWSGVAVSTANAMKATAVFAAVRLLSEGVASLPLKVYERLDRGKREARRHPVYNLLHNNSNPIMSSFTFREVQQATLSLWGNSYAEIVRNMATVPTALYPIPAEIVEPRIVNGVQLVYDIQHPTEGKITLPAEKVLHVPGLSTNGVKGLSPIAMARQAIGTMLATEEYAARFFGENNATPRGVIEIEGELGDKAYKRLKKDWNKNFGGRANAHKTAILEGGKFNPLTMPAKDAQFLETRQFQIAEIARIYNIPPHMLRDMSNATFSNIEHQSLEFVIYTLRPWLVRWESEINRKLFKPGSRFFCEFEVDGLLRGDVEARHKTYAQGRQWGYYSVNDIRALENKPLLPPEVGDQYMVPLNMQPAGSMEANSKNLASSGVVAGSLLGPAAPAAAKASEEGADHRPATARATPKYLQAAYLPLLVDAFNHVFVKGVTEARRVLKRSRAHDNNLLLFKQWFAEEFSSEEGKKFATSRLLPVVRALTIGIRAKDSGDVMDEGRVQAYTSALVTRHCERCRFELAATPESDHEKVLDTWLREGALATATDEIKRIQETFYKEKGQ